MSAEPCATLAPCDSNLAPPERMACSHRIVRAHVHIAARARDVDNRWPAALDVDIAFRYHVLHGVVGSNSMVPLSAVSVRSGCSMRAFSSVACLGVF